MPALVGKACGVGNSLTAAAAPVYAKHWYDLGIEYYPDWYGELDGSNRPYNLAVAGATANVYAGMHGATVTSAYRVDGLFGDQIYRTVLGLDVGAGALLEAGTSNVAIFRILENDFSPLQNVAYESLYLGRWGQSTIDDYLDGAFRALFGGVDDYLGYGTGYPIIGNCISYSKSPYVQGLFPSASGRLLVDAAIHRLNERIRLECKRRRIPMIDFDLLYATLLAGDTITLGGQVIQSHEGGDDSTFAFQEDEIHPNKPVSATELETVNHMLADYIDDIEYARPSESDICEVCDLPTGGADTLKLDFRRFLHNFARNQRIGAARDLQAFPLSINGQSVPCDDRLEVIADATNEDVVYIGDADVDAASGYELGPGERVIIHSTHGDPADPARTYAMSPTSGNGVRYIAA